MARDSEPATGDDRRVGALRRRAPILLGSAGVAGALAGVALLAPNHVTRAHNWPYFVDDAVQGLAFSAAALWIARGRPGHPVATLLGVIGALHGVSLAAGQWSIFALAEHPGLPLGAAAGFVESGAYVPALALLITLLPLLAPDGRLPPGRRWRWLARAIAAALGLVVAGIVLAPYAHDTVEPSVSRFGVTLAAPVGVPVGRVLLGVGLVGSLVLALPCLGSLVVRTARAREEPRRSQLRWVTAGLGVAVCGVALGIAVPPADPWLQAATLPAFPAGIAVAVVRHRLFDLDVVLRRGLLFGVLTAAAVVVYLGVVAAAGAVVGDGVGPALLASAAVAGVFGGVRDWAQRRVDRLVYGDRADPLVALQRLGRRLEETTEPDAVPGRVLEAVTAALRAPRATIDAAGVLRAERGTRDAPGSPLRLPLVAHGEAVGELAVWPRTAGERYSAADRRLLADLARQAGPAVRAVALAADLQRSREGLVLAREEERRRLRADLHDGLGPALTGIAMQLDAAQALQTTDPERSRALVGRGAEEARAAILDVRRVVDALRPAALDDLGLLGALGERAAALEGLEVRLEVGDGVGALPAAVEVAVFRIVQEALTNAARHAGARACDVRLRRNGALEVEVSDDGVGLPASARPGVGLRSMRERAEELGGTWAIDERPGGGTRVRVRLPVREDG